TSAQLGGDGLGYHWIDSERFALYLLDVSGHGVKSALLAVSIIDTLRTCGLADTDWNDLGCCASRVEPCLFFTITRAFLFHNLVRHRGLNEPNVALRWRGPSSRSSSCGAMQNPTLPASGPPVGCFANATYRTVEMVSGSADRRISFSDGVFETRRHED